MKHFIKVFFLFTGIFLIFCGCKKYEDGDTFTLLLKSYIVNDWKIEKKFYVNSGLDITPTNNYWIQFKRDFSYVEHTADTVSSEGSWALDGKKEEFILIPDSYFMGFQQMGIIYKIMRLESKRFRIRSNSTEPVEIHFIPQ